MNSSLIGYARVSTADQDPELQRQALDEAGCSRIFIDHGVSGTKRDRPELTKALDYVRDGDTLVVWKLDRLGRSLPHLIEVVTGLGERGVGFRSLTEGFDTTTPGGKLLFHVLGSLAEFERALIVERTLAGLAAARAAGRLGGRPRALKPAAVRTTREMFTAGRTVTEIAETLKVGRATVYRALATEPAAA